MKTTRRERAEERRASAQRIAQAQAETQAVVASGVCPLCGSALKRNTSLAGWWQCGQFGAVGFRADATRPACGWQGFTH